MKCELIFKIDDKEIPLIIESESPTYPTNNEILEALKNPINAEQRQELYSYIKENYDIRSNNTLDVDEILKNPDGLIGNTTSSELSRLVPDAKFPEGVNVKVLAVNKIKSGGRTISGRCINSNGEELFIINNTSDAIKLANFLTIRKTLEDNPDIFDENSDDYKDLEILKQKLKKRNIAELIIDFIEYNSDFKIKYDNPNRVDYFINSKGKTTSAFVFLDRIARQIQGSQQAKQYYDPFVNAINRLHRIRKKNDDLEFGINYKELFYAIKAFYPNNAVVSDIKTVETFKNRVKSTDFDAKKYGYKENEVIEGKPLIFTLFNNLIKNEKRYQYEISSYNNDEILIKWKFETLKSLYGYSYNTISTFDLLPNYYKGYKIYSFNDNGKKQYIYSRNYLTEDTNIDKVFNSKEELEQYLNEKVLTEKLKTNSFLKFKLRSKIGDSYDQSKYIYKIENSPQVFKPGMIVESLAIPIDPITKIKDDEKKLLDDKKSTLMDFYNLVNSWNIDENIKSSIINKINNAEKAVTYIYKINENLGEDRTNQNRLEGIATYISSASTVAYYINSNNGNNYTLIPTEPNVIEEWKKDKSIPVVQILQAMKEVLQKKIGVNINLLTSSEIKNKFSNISGIDPNISRAFIYNGEIYVNTTIASGEDLLHEYTHIMLGILKSNPESRKHYEQLVNYVWEHSKRDHDQVKKDYKGRSKMDIREELFARKFSAYLLNNRTSNLGEIFQQQEDYMKEGMKTIFDLLGEESLSSTYSKSVDFLFRRFSSDIATLLKNGSGLDLDNIKNTRKKTEFINKQIKDGNILEIC